MHLAVIAKMAGGHPQNAADGALDDSGLDLTLRLKNKEARAEIHSNFAHLQTGQSSRC